MLIIVKTVLFLFIVLLLLLLSLIFMKLHKLVKWRWTNAYTSQDLAFFYDELTKEEMSDPGKYMKKHLTYKAYTGVAILLLICFVATIAGSMAYDKSFRSALLPTGERIEYCKEIVTKLYTTHPNDFDKLWEEDLKYKIDESISFRLNPNLIENLAQRHRVLNSESTTLTFKSWYSNSANEILLWYIIKSPTVEETRQMIFMLDENNVIVDMHEYKEPETALEYLIGEP